MDLAEDFSVSNDTLAAAARLAAYHRRHPGEGELAKTVELTDREARMLASSGAAPRAFVLLESIAPRLGLEVTRA